VDALVGTVVPGIVILVMTIVGMELTARDFVRLGERRGPFLASVGGQLVLVPLLAAAIVLALAPPPAIAGGLLLVATCPVAAMTNFYAMVSRADLALAVSLTAVSGLLGLVAMPVMLPLSLEWLLASEGVGRVPAAAIVRQLALGLIVPVLAGMTIRRIAPAWVAGNAHRLQGASLAGVVIVLAIVVVEQATLIRESFAWIVAVAVLFTAAALGAGFGLGRLAGWPWPVSATLGLTFATRNVGIAALIAAALWQSFAFAAFAAVFFSVQFLLFAPLLARWRRMAGASSGHPA
jgi:BASS family bile acid:Na+ symporter